jgi:hypothetical protein
MPSTSQNRCARSVARTVKTARMPAPSQRLSGTAGPMSLSTTSRVRSPPSTAVAECRPAARDCHAPAAASHRPGQGHVLRLQADPRSAAPRPAGVHRRSPASAQAGRDAVAWDSRLRAPPSILSSRPEEFHLRALPEPCRPSRVTRLPMFGRCHDIAPNGGLYPVLRSGLSSDRRRCGKDTIQRGLAAYER